MESWQHINLEEQLAGITAASFQKPQLIFKHSIRCGISTHVMHSLGRATSTLSEKLDLHYLDLIRFRGLSNLIASELKVVHQSPQVLLLKDGAVVYHKSHFSIDPEKILGAV